MALLILAALALLSVAEAATLSANYPINAQLPPVARVAQPFRFTFAQSTFSNTDSDTTYSLKDAPSWLRVDSSTRTLLGTPQSDHNDSNKFKLVASNGSGSASMDVTLIVTADQGPRIGKPLVSQLQALGPVSYPSTLFLHPGRPFAISFSQDTFDNTHPSTIYYGTSPHNTPLPSWINFDAASLKFSGTTPSFPGSGPEAYTFQLIASDVAGFSAANMTFQLVIGPHILAFNETVQAFNLARGQKFSSPDFRDLLSLDGSPASSKDLNQVNAQLPDWLTLDNATISLSGTPTQDAVNQNVTITVTDTYQDEAELMVRLEFLKLFLDTVQGCNAIAGEEFMFVFNQSIVNDQSAQLDVDLNQQLSSWLNYNPDNKTLYGHVPADLQPQTFNIPLTAQQGTITDTQDFELNVVKAPNTHPGSSNPFLDSASPSRKKAGIIAMSVVIPVVTVLSLLIFYICWRRRGRPSTLEEGPSKAKPPPPRPARPDIPDIPSCEPAQNEQPPRKDTSDVWMSPISPASDLPKLELGPVWNVESFENQGRSANAVPQPSPPRSPAKGGFVPLRDSIIEEGKQVNNSPSPSKKQTQRLSFTTSPPVRRRTSNRSRREPLKTIQPRTIGSVQSSRSRRYSKRSSGISSVASGLPARLSGAGHGAGGFGPPGHGIVQLSWQNPKPSFPSDENSLTNIAQMFPRPPTRTRHSMASSIPEPSKRVTLRTVEPDESTISEADSLEAFVQSRAKHRNSANPLFSAQLSRRTSSGPRALERARSLRSRADTVSVSTFSDEYRQSIQERPVSTAISVSEYGDDNRLSAYQNLQPPPNLLPLTEGSAMGQSQLSLAQDYRGVISPLPRFWSMNSLSSTLRLGSGNHAKTVSAQKNNEEMPQSPSMASDLVEHLSRKASPTKEDNEDLRKGSLEPPPLLKSGNDHGLPIASSGELAFV